MVLRRSRLLFFAAGAVITVAVLLFYRLASSKPASGPPNIVLILMNDQGWGDLSLHGNEDIRTPHIDRLAREGAIFERFYVSPVCSPTRAEILTGCYQTSAAFASR